MLKCRMSRKEKRWGCGGNKPFHSARFTVNMILLSSDFLIEIREMIVGDRKEVVRKLYEG